MNKHYSSQENFSRSNNRFIYIKKNPIVSNLQKNKKNNLSNSQPESFYKRGNHIEENSDKNFIPEENFRINFCEKKEKNFINTLRNHLRFANINLNAHSLITIRTAGQLSGLMMGKENSKQDNIITLLTKEIDVIRSRNEKLEKELESSEKNVITMNKKNEDYEKENKSLKLKCAKLEENLTYLKAMNENLKSEKKEVINKYYKGLDELKDITKRFKDKIEDVNIII